MSNLQCTCGFQFSGSGEFRNCEAFTTPDGQSGVVCPDCGTHYVNGQKMEMITIHENLSGNYFYHDERSFFYQNLPVFE